MWFTPEVRRILAYSKPVDLRKSIDGLVGLVKSVLEEDPLSGSLFVFVNRRGNYVKLVNLSPELKEQGRQSSEEG